MRFFAEFIIEVVVEFILHDILYGLYYILQRIGADVRWLFFLGNKKSEYLLLQRELNAVIAVLIIVIGIGLTNFLNYY